MKKSFFKFVSFAFCSLFVLPSVAQNETIVTLSGNAYVTEGKAHIDEGRSAIQDWNNTDAVISFYFKAEKAGKIKKGDRVVVTAGVPLGVSGNTNMIRVVEV